MADSLDPENGDLRSSGGQVVLGAVAGTLLGLVVQLIAASASKAPASASFPWLGPLSTGAAVGLLFALADLRALRPRPRTLAVGALSGGLVGLVGGVAWGPVASLLLSWADPADRLSPLVAVLGGLGIGAVVGLAISIYSAYGRGAFTAGEALVVDSETNP